MDFTLKAPSFLKKFSEFAGKSIPISMEIIADGTQANENPAASYRGFGCITGSNSSRLLLDYKVEHPKEYEEIMRLLFQKDYGIGLGHVKIELGSDVNTFSGVEPSTKRYVDERLDVTRGAGFQFAADAKAINPDITVDLIRCSEPAWVTKAFSTSQEHGLNARYTWYKETLEAAYRVYNLKFDFISADQNAAEIADEAWILYLRYRLDHEKNTPYDYRKIKIVASDEAGTRNIAAQMVENNALRNAVDVIGLHHTTYGDSYTNLLNEAYGKEIWYSEGAAPCNCSDLTVEADQSGIAGKNGAIDIANRIINSYYNGKMTMYEFQPAVAACYDGSTDMPKYLIKASEPWSGYYKLESGFWMAMHFSRFSPKGWMFVNGACYGDGEENQSITDTTNNFMTLVSPDRAEMTMHFTNEDLVPRTYSVIVKDMAFENRTLSAIITTGPNPGQPYNANWFRCAKPVRPSHRNEETYFVKVPPQSILTLTTLDTSWVNGVETFSHTSPNSERLPLPYIDDFNYPKEEIMIRGCAPRYTTDQGGAFELIRAEKDKNVVCQRVVSSKVPLNSKLRGTPNPITTVGDDKWRSYSAEIDVKLDNCNQDNYAGFGIRYNSSSTCENSARCGYIGLLYGNGEWKLMDMDEVAAEGQLQNIQTNQWNNLKLLVLGNSILFFINGNLMTTYRPQCMINSGRVSFCSAYEMNTFSNLKVTPMPILPLYVRRVDCFSDSIFYNEYWDICQEEKYTFYNRTAMRANKNAAFSCAFTGTGISVIGTARNAEFRVMIDDTILYESLFIPYCSPRQACLVVDQLKDNIVHTIEMTLLSGDFKLDVIEIPENHILMPDILEVTSAAEAAAKEHENMIRRQRQAEKNAEQKANETLERAVEALNDIQVDTSDEDEYIEDNENTKIIKEIISSGQIHDEVIADFVKVVKPEKSKNDNRFEEDKEVSDDVQSEQQDDMPLYGEPEEENVYEEKEPATEPRYKGFLRKLLSSQPKEIDNRETEIQQPVLESEVEEPIPEIYEQQYVQPQRTPVQREQRVVREPMPEAYEQQYVQPQRTLVQREQRIAREQMPEAYEQQYVQPQRTPIQREQRVVRESMPETYEQQYVQPQRTPVQREQMITREAMPETYEQQYVQPQRAPIQREQRVAREAMPETYEQQYVQPQRTPIQREQRVVREPMPETYEQQYLQPQKQNINNNTSDKQFSADDIEMLIRAVKSGNYDSAKTIAEMIRPTSKNSNTSDSYREVQYNNTSGDLDYNNNSIYENVNAKQTETSYKPTARPQKKPKRESEKKRSYSPEIESLLQNIKVGNYEPPKVDSTKENSIKSSHIKKSQSNSNIENTGYIRQNNISQVSTSSNYTENNNYQNNLNNNPYTNVPAEEYNTVASALSNIMNKKSNSKRPPHLEDSEKSASYRDDFNIDIDI